MKKRSLFFLIFAGALAFVFFFPRFLIFAFGEASPWTSYFYLYAFGFMFFGWGLFSVIYMGAAKWGRGRDSRWITFLILGLFAFAGLHALWIWAALKIPFLG